MTLAPLAASNGLLDSAMKQTILLLPTLLFLICITSYGQRPRKPQIDFQQKIAEATPTSLPAIPSGARKSSDTKDQNLKGNVKSVREYSIESGKHCIEKEESFDPNGNETRIINYTDCYPDSVSVFGSLDGMLVSRGRDVEYKDGEKPPSKDFILTVRAEDNALNPNAPRDRRYDMRRTYEYDEKVRLIEQDVYQNNGEVWSRHLYRYDGNKRVISDHDNKDQEISKTAEYLGEDGDKTREEQYGPGDKVDTVIAYNYVRDQHGNWTVQKAFEVKKTRGKDVLKPMWTSYRTITYYP